jgi:hypothetical protein
MSGNVSHLRSIALAALALLAAACGSTAQAGVVTQPPPRPVLHEATDSTIGITNTAQGYTFDSSTTVLDGSQLYQFRILGGDGTPHTTFLFDNTKLLHLYAIREDLTNFHHVHPTMASDGTWSVRLPLDLAGPYNLYVDFLLRDPLGLPRHLVLRRTLSVPGSYKLSPVIPAPSMSAEGDGYTITFLTAPKPWTVMYLPARVTRGGKPVTDIQPYLANYAHFTSFQVTTGLVGHAHPLEYAGAGREGWPDISNSLRGGPIMTFHAEFPGAGDYRAFIEFQTGGELHTAQMTIHVK